MRVGHHQVINHPRELGRMTMWLMDGLVGAIDWGNETLVSLADVINEVSATKIAKIALSKSLFEEVGNLWGFELEHNSKYFTYLIANPDIVRVFIKLQLLYKKRSKRNMRLREARSRTCTWEAVARLHGRAGCASAREGLRASRVDAPLHLTVPLCLE
jgi:hypothetical protein